MENCHKCPLSRSRINVVCGQIVKGSRILFLGEAPGYSEDQLRKPFVGRSGVALDKMFVKHHIPRNSVSIINSVSCKPPENRQPKDEEVFACFPYLERHVDIIRPGIIVALGKTAHWTLANADLISKKQSYQMVLGTLKETFKKVHKTTIGGKLYPYITMYHPSYLLRNSTDALYYTNLQFQLLVNLTKKF